MLVWIAAFPLSHSSQAQDRPFTGTNRDSRSLAQAPLGASEVETKILAVLAEMEKDLRYANVSPTDGRFLRQMTEAIDAKRVVELGTSTGYSGIWFALALKSTGGKLFTHEIDPERIQVAKANFQKAGVSDVITVIEGDAHETVQQHEAPIDLVFIDADKPGYVDYLKKVLPKVRPGGLILAHNMHTPPPDPAFVEAITTDPQLETTFVLMDGAGISVSLKKRPR
jgi:predicted O-methyltransferase YrrM